MGARSSRVCWFADLEALTKDLGVLEVLRDEAGLTTLVPESHISHTSGFRASAVIADGPLKDWRERPGLADHRAVFGVSESAMAVLPGVVGGVDDGPLLRVIDECRRLGIEVWGHAGVWCYGAEVFPEFAAVDLFGRSLLPASLPWGTMFCPSQPALHDWVAASLAEAAATYDLDGWFLDHARYPSPGFAPSWLACGCGRCGDAAAARGADLDACRSDIMAMAGAISSVRPGDATTLAAAGPVAMSGWLSRWPGVLRWLDVRAQILADRFADLGAAIQRASRRPVEFGSDVYPPGVALLGGHDHAAWSRSATYFTGGFGGKIGWGSVGRVTAAGAGAVLAGLVSDLGRESASRVAANLVGAGPDLDPSRDEDALITEVYRMGAAHGDTPVYPPIILSSPESLTRVCRAIVDARLQGAMVAGLELATAEQRAVLRTTLSERLP